MVPFVKEKILLKFHDFPECGQWSLLLSDPGASAPRPSLLPLYTLHYTTLHSLQDLTTRINTQAVESTRNLKQGVHSNSFLCQQETSVLKCSMGESSSQTPHRVHYYTFWSPRVRD